MGENPKEDAMILAIIALVLLCKLTFNIIVYALPFYVGVTAAITLHSSGAGWMASGAAGIAVAIATLVLSHWLLALTKSPFTLGLIGVAFAAPCHRLFGRLRCLAQAR